MSTFSVIFDRKNDLGNQVAILAGREPAGLVYAKQKGKKMILIKRTGW